MSNFDDGTTHLTIFQGHRCVSFNRKKFLSDEIEMLFDSLDHEHTTEIFLYNFFYCSSYFREINDMSLDMTKKL